MKKTCFTEEQIIGAIRAINFIENTFSRNFSGQIICICKVSELDLNTLYQMGDEINLAVFHYIDLAL